MSDPRQAHWENVYTVKAEQDVSWFEDSPNLSLGLIDELGIVPPASVVDIGGGASRLVDALADRGHADLTVLDLSAAALTVAQHRLGHAAGVNWIVADVTGWQPERRFDLWHDRAALHFLVEHEHRQGYVRAMRRALPPGAHAIIGTFAPDGPEKCSGLEVVRYDQASLGAVLGPDFEPIGHLRHTHLTPWGAEQRFQFTTFRRR